MTNKKAGSIIFFPTNVHIVNDHNISL